MVINICKEVSYMPIVSGVVQAISSKGPEQGEFGPYYRLGLNINGEWYNLLNNSSTPVSVSGEVIQQGSIVEFMYDTTVGKNGSSNKRVNKKTLTTSQKQSNQAAQETKEQSKTTPQVKKAPDYNVGVGVGHAWNCAFKEALELLSDHETKVDLNKVAKRTKEIYDAVAKVKEDIMNPEVTSEDLPFDVDVKYPEI